MRIYSIIVYLVIVHIDDARKNRRPKVIQYLKSLKDLPPNGLAIYCGYVQDEMIFEYIVPPKPLHTPIYRCSNVFLVEPILAMSRIESIIGVVAIDNDSCGIGIIDSATGNWECLDEQTSGVGGKSGKGGSSQRRYERNRAA